jgi:hypothetical protein
MIRTIEMQAERLMDLIRTLIEEQFTGYVKVNFGQGGIGRIEKFEEILKWRLIRNASITFTPVWQNLFGSRENPPGGFTRTCLQTSISRVSESMSSRIIRSRASLRSDPSLPVRPPKTL